MGRRSFYHLETNVDLPPPLDRCPDFPTVCFSPGGYPVLLQARADAKPTTDTTVFQIVPGEENPFVQAYGAGFPRNWEHPQTIQDILNEWSDLEAEIVLHERHPDVRPQGISGGKARFLCGAGMAVFVIKELGLIPDGTMCGGIALHRMVATFGAEFPDPGWINATYHIFPAEYLVDPSLPGIPAGLTLQDALRWVPPPPEFNRGPPVTHAPKLSYAYITHDSSEVEIDEGGGSLLDRTLRTSSYYRAIGNRPRTSI